MVLKIAFILWVLLISMILINFASPEECGIFNKNDNIPPWIVGIYLEDPVIKQSELVCLGSFIHGDIILTAAHCFCEGLSNRIRNNSIYIKTGLLQKFLDIDDERLLKVERNDIFVNNMYQGISGVTGDVAAVKFNNLDKTVKPICVDWDATLGSAQTAEQEISHPAWRNGKIFLVEEKLIPYDTCLNMVVNKTLGAFVSVDKICTQMNKLYGFQTQMSKDSYAMVTIFPIDGKSMKMKITSLSTDEKIINLKDALEEDAIDNGAGLMKLNPTDNLWYIKGIATFNIGEKTELRSLSNLNMYLNWLVSVCTPV